MRHIGPIVLSLLLATCGGAQPTTASSPTPPISPSASVVPSASVAAVATAMPTYPPKAEGFSSKVLVEKPRSVETSAPGLVWIVVGAATSGNGVSAAVSEKESFTASYQVPIDRQAADAKAALYLSPDLPPLAAGRYTESLRLVTVQTGGRSAAHMHSGIEGVLVLEGRVLVRSAGNSPASLATGQGFIILPKVPVQLINIGDAVARTLVYSISPEGSPFSTELEQSP
jgi:quercetin dioxygenase-like cupin family protein